MNERIREFLKAENKSSAQLAEEIDVQPSGISHILSGRNNPSLDFVLKMLEKYQFLSTDWLLFGKGSMYKDDKMQTLFEENGEESTNNEAVIDRNALQGSDLEPQDGQRSAVRRDLLIPSGNSTSVVEKIVWFYDDNSFEEYFPSR